MRFAHLSDLHIGKRVNGFSMIEDQKYILSKIINIIKEEQVEAVLLAGDIYDKVIPSAEAVQLLNDFLINLSEYQIPIFIISGNHDSPERLAFGATFLKNSNIYISEVYGGLIEPITLEDDYGEIQVYLMPFLKPAMVRHALNREDIKTYQEAVQAAIDQLQLDKTKRNVALSHQFVIGATRSDSEEISVGGLDQIAHSVFDGFDYIALGHIHGPQYIGKETIRYCGTPLKYSFSEASHIKSLTIVDIKEKGTVAVRAIPLKPLRDMRKIRGMFHEITDPNYYKAENREDYIQVTLLDEEEVMNGLERLRSIYPNIMRLEYDNKRTRERREILGEADIEQKTEFELFEEFYQYQNNQNMSEEQKEIVSSMIEKIREEEE